MMRWLALCGLLVVGLPSLLVVYRYLTRRSRSEGGFTQGSHSEHVWYQKRCPECGRAFEALFRFCPIDAEELLPVTYTGFSDDGLHPIKLNHVHLVGDGKICPICAAKYGHAAFYCGRDGSTLVPIN